MSIIKGTVDLHVKEGGCEFVVDINMDVVKPNVVYYVYVCLDIHSSTFLTLLPFFFMFSTLVERK